MKRYIVIRTSFEATHCWPECPLENVAFLRTPHRHVFHVEARAEVDHDDRQIEFIDLKQRITQFLRSTWDRKDLKRMSCERMAETLLTTFHELCQASVFEDGENGAIVCRK